MQKLEETQEYLESLPRKRSGAGALIFNAAGELLIVKPTYKEGWAIPGGTVEKNESPRIACIREVKEEIGLDVPNMEFTCLDYQNSRGESFQFMFNGGIISDDQIAQIKLQESELSEYKFVTIDESMNLLSPRLAVRVPKCAEAIKNSKPLYLENAGYV